MEGAREVEQAEGDVQESADNIEESGDDAFGHEHLEEQMHMARIMNAMLDYEACMRSDVALRRRRWESLSAEHQAAVPDMLKHLHRIEIAARANMFLLRTVLVYIKGDEKLVPNHFDPSNTPEKALPNMDDREKVRSTLRQIVRDWSEEGAREREVCYTPLIEELMARIPIKSGERKPRVLCPGAGLGRLMWEVVSRGYECQGNEWSYFMLYMSNLILNYVQKPKEFVVYPYIHSGSNIVNTADAIRAIRTPDVLPTDLPEDSNFSMCAGDFVEVYADQHKQWDCVMTCFFIDTARNIIEYVETIAQILVDGGWWLNLGPLLYHWENIHDELSVELSWEQLRPVIISKGFEIEVRNTVPEMMHRRNA